MAQPAFDFGDEALDDPTNPTYTVSELAAAINDQFRRGFREGVWVRGEITGLQDRGPHTYFSLVEDGVDGKAVLRVQLFAPAKRRLTPVLKKARLELANGMKVRIHGYLDFWAQGGTLGLKMSGIDPRYTLGDIAQSRDAIMRRLVASGLIDANSHRPFSPIPLRVGVATSVESAAWADFRHELEASGYAFELTVADTRVQGELAPPMIAGAIGTLNRRAVHGELDVIVVIRGGGARNELAVFDSEAIARTIAGAHVPVLTGLGHEIDRSIADEVAHTALKTPTACAGALIERVSAFVANTEMAWQAIVRHGDVLLRRHEQRLHDVGRAIAARTHGAIERAGDRLTMRRTVLAGTAPASLERSEQRLALASSRLAERAGRVAERETSRLDVLDARIRAVDPAVQLARGWSITRDAAGSVVRSAERLTTGDELTTLLVDGSVSSTVTAVDPTNPTPSEDAHDD